ncbi:unnamed protein product [Moneuplotes crassus]|uniref:HECT-type E3 ubiquitin transferase n=1 Tax=Euplotes crassus TaxID=5936 RepID=A0AAD1UGT4_EUPCR|nr:unnamed protein product [Moneuplotes crassus]
MGCCTSSYVSKNGPQKIAISESSKIEDEAIPISLSIPARTPRRALIEEEEKKLPPSESHSIRLCNYTIEISNCSDSESDSEEDSDDSSNFEEPMYCPECGRGISDEDELLQHLFSCRTQAAQNIQNDQDISKANADEASKYDAEKKRTWFRENIAKLRVSSCGDTITLVVSRDNILEETFNQFSTVDRLDFRKDLKIFFIDENARDAGGVIREWLNLVTIEILKPEAKIFEMVNNSEDTFYTIHPEATYGMCHFAGQFLGKAIFEGAPLDGRLSKLLLMKMLLKEPKLEDLKLYDEQLYSSIAFILQDSVNASDLCMNFTILDNGKTVELKQNGADIELTNENKEEYSRLVVEHYTYKRAEIQTAAFTEAFFNIIPQETITVFSLYELDKILFGLKEIDVEDWKKNTFYKGEYEKNKNHDTIKWFWEVIVSLNNDEKRKFLQFCTGSRSLPIEGFKGLKRNSRTLCKFSINSLSAGRNLFLRAHTCFNSIDLPMFKTKEEVESAVRFILDQEKFYFGLS